MLVHTWLGEWERIYAADLLVWKIVLEDVRFVLRLQFAAISGHVCFLNGRKLPVRLPFASGLLLTIQLRRH